MEKIRVLARKTRDEMDGLNAKVSSPGQRFKTLMIKSHGEATRLGYGGSQSEWLGFVKRIKG